MSNSSNNKFSCATENRTIHFNLSHIPDHSDLRLHANATEYELNTHNKTSLKKAIEEMPFLQVIPKDEVTHYIEDLPMPLERPALVTVSIPHEIDGNVLRNTVAMHINVPESGIRSARKSLVKQAAFSSEEVHIKLKAYGINKETLLAANLDPLFPPHVNNYNDAIETAKALLFHHNALTNLKPNVSAHILEGCITNALRASPLPYQIKSLGDGWQTKEPMIDTTTTPHVQMTGSKGQLLYTTKINLNVLNDMTEPLQKAIEASQDDVFLQGHLWSVQSGHSSDTYGATSGASFEATTSTQENRAISWKRKYYSAEHGLTVDPTPNWDGETITINCKNHWNRHLGVFVEFLDTAGNPILPDDWDEQVSYDLREFVEPNSQIKYITIVPPVNEISGIPLDPVNTSISFKVPTKANTFKLYWGGPGMGYNGDVCPPGIFMTACFEVALPVFILTVGASLDSTSWVKAMLKDKAVRQAIYLIGKTIFASSPHLAQSSGDLVKIIEALGKSFVPMLLKTAIKRVLARYITEGAMEMATPFIDIAFLAYNVLVTADLLTQTTYAIFNSPAYYESDYTSTIDLSIELIPDSRYHKFPDEASHYQVWAVYDTKATTPKQTFYLQGSPPRSAPIYVHFPGIPAGGKLKVFVTFYAPNDWVAGQGSSVSVNAYGSNKSTVTINNIEIKTNPVPLSGDSVYKHSTKLVFNGVHKWESAPAPTNTLHNSNGDLRGLSAITMAQNPSSIGYAWQGTPGYTAQNISLLENPESAYQALNHHYTQKTGICYDVTSEANSNGNNFFLDNLGNSHYLRKIALSYQGAAHAGPFQPNSNQSYGQFPVALDDYAVHPQGYVFGISTGNHKIFSCKLSKTPVSDSQAPHAAILSGKGSRPGLVDGPTSIAVGLDGTIFVLESNNRRIQAFDTCGNPINHFNGSPHMPLINGGTYLDMDVESKGYIYVLYNTDGGYSANNYKMDIYNPNGTFLVTTPNVAAGKLTVSLLRNVFTLNYETIQGHRGTEPSISMWMPPVPNPSI
jgi:hypothetical protein